MQSQRRKKACKECRTHKIKCSAEPPEICSRCRRLRLSCVLTSDTRSRQTKAQLQRELEALKSLAKQPTQSVQHSNTGTTYIPGQHQANIETPASSGPLLCSSEQIHVVSFPDTTCSPRVLDGQELSSSEISHCFKLFFQNYNPILPILDQQDGNPDDFYRKSSFLFWTVVFIGSKRYGGGPTIMDFLAPRMNKLALLALENSNNHMDTLRGIILLCHWPVPISSMYKDMTNTLSGTALHLAMQIGLHIVGTGQDFSRTVLPSDADHSSRISRAQLWINCLITYQNTGLRQGILPLVLLDSPQAKTSEKNLSPQFSDDVRFHRQMHNILITATSSLARLIPTVGSDSPSELYPSISLYDTQLQEMALDTMSTLNTIYLHCYRIHLLAYHFLDWPSLDHGGLIKLYTISYKLIEYLTSEDQSVGFARACPDFIHKTTLLAAISILKIQKSELVRHINSASGEKAYFSAIYLCQRISLQSNDLGARGVIILGQMWTSKNMYRRPDGRVDSLSTRIRSRLSMSVVFDSFWWWRVEFNGQTSPYPEQNHIARVTVQADTTTGLDASQGFEPSEAAQVAALPTGPVGSILDMIPLDEPFPDFDWAVNFDFQD